MITFFKKFDSFKNDEASKVFMIYPNIFQDDRGSFAEILKSEISNQNNEINWITNLNWIKQINRSKSINGTIRGCHAQASPFCQGKLVQAVTGTVYDIITDVRPDSKSFGLTSIFILNETNQNMLWVPRGFLHSFVIPMQTQVKETIFEYYCDCTYDKKSEIHINPMTILPNCINQLNKSNKFNSLINLFKNEKNIKLSDNDKNAIDYNIWIKQILNQFKTTGKTWYK